MPLRIRSGESNFMTPAARSELLNARRLPARLTVERVAVLLGMSEDAIRILMTQKLLWFLGTPAENGPKFFVAEEIERLRLDCEWLAKASNALVKHSREKNHKSAGKACITKQGKVPERSRYSYDQTAPNGHNTVAAVS